MRRIVDLSLPLYEGMSTYPARWHPRVSVKLMGRFSVEGRQTRRLVLGTHTGTHVDAPLHFIPGGETVERIPLETLIGLARVIDLPSHKGRKEISAQELRQRVDGRRVTRLIVRTGWSSHWGKPDYYTGYPYFSREAARWLVRQGVKLLGLDTPSPDNPAHHRHAKVDSPNHKVLLGNGVVLVEYLANLHRIRRRTVELIVLPLYLRGCDGSPARCVAVEAG